jgi:hypothetical protein
MWRAVLAVAGLLACAPQQAAAFWPFTTHAPAIVDSMLTAEKLQERFSLWTENSPLEPPPPPALGTVTMPNPANAGTQMPKTPLPDTTVTPDSSRTTNLPPEVNAPQSPADSTLSSLGITPADSVNAAIAASDSLASGDAAGDTSGLDANPPGSQPQMPPLMPPAAIAAALERGFAPDLTSKMMMSNDNVRGSTDLSASFTDPSGITLLSALGYSEDISLTQHTDLQNRTFTNNLNFPFRDKGLLFGISTSNSRMDQTGRTISNALTSNKTENKGAEASVQVGRKLDRIPWVRRMGWGVVGWSANAFYARRSSQNAQDIVAVQGTGAGTRRHFGDGNSYGGGVAFDRFRWMSLRARLGTTGIDNLDRSPTLPNGEQTSTSDGDTATVDISVPTFWRADKLTFGYRLTHGSDSYTDQVRNASGSQTGDIGNYALETKRGYSRAINFGAHAKPLGFLDLGLTLNATRDSTSYRLKPNSYVDTDRLGWRLETRWSAWGSILSVNYESSVSKVNQDQGLRTNPNTRRDEERKMFAETTKNFTKTLIMHIFGEMQLNQGIYEHEGPTGKQDRDDLRWRFGGDLNGAIGPNVTANVTAYIRAYDQAFIDARTAINSRNETEYIIRNGYTWRINPRVSVGQNFGLGSKVLDVVFSPLENTLNRNHFMNTHMECTITSRFSTNASYDYLLTDNGGYIRVTGDPEPFFSPTQRTKKDGIGVGFRYDVISGGKLAFLSRQESTRQRSTSFNGRPPTITNRGNLALGFESKLETHGLKLDCRFQWNKNFNVALNSSEYYNVDATLQYTF